MSYFSDYSDPQESLSQGWQIPFDQKMNRGSRINMPGINLSPRGTINLGTNRQPDQDSNVIFDSPFGNKRRTFGAQGNGAFGAAPGWSQNLLSDFGGDNFSPSYSSPASYSSSPVRGGFWPRERNDVEREIPIIRSDHSEDQDNSYYKSGGQEDSDVRDIPIQVCRGQSPNRRGCHTSPHNQHALHSPTNDDSHHRGGYTNSNRGRGRGNTASRGMGRGGGLGGRRTPSPTKNKANQGHHYHQPASPKKAAVSPPPPPHYAQPLGHDHQRSHDEAHAASRDKHAENKPNTTPPSPKSLSSVREIPIITTQDARRNMQQHQLQHENARRSAPTGQRNAWQQQMDDGAEKLAKVVDFTRKGPEGVSDEEIPIPVERVGNGCGPSKDHYDAKGKQKGDSCKARPQVENHEMDQNDAQPPTPPVKVSAPPNPTTVVNEITTHLNDDLKPRVHAFQPGPGAKLSKEFLYLDDALTKALIKLDAIDAGGDEGVRKLRRDAVHAVDQCAAQLESKVKAEGDKGGVTSATGDGSNGDDQDGAGGEEPEGYATPPTPSEDYNQNQPSGSADNNDIPNAPDPKL